MKRRPTINDVASMTGLSISTVSLVINNKPNVSDATRKLVQDAVTELGYHPFHSARGLASKLSGNLGFILSEDHFSQAEPFYTKIFLGTEFEARRQNYYVLLTTVANRFKGDVEIPRFLLEHNVDGVIVAGKVDKRWIDYILTQNIPLVLVDFAVKRPNLSSVQIDNHTGALMAVRHLVQLGHRSIGFIGGDIRHPSIRERFEGYQDGLAEAGIEMNKQHISIDETDTTVENGQRAAETLFGAGRVRPTALFTANDAMAIGAMRYIQRMGIRIPTEMSIVGFDDIDMGLITEPRLTTIRVYKEEMGKLAVRHLSEVLKSGTGATVTMQVPVELVVRESTQRFVHHRAGGTERTRSNALQG